jgi:hypothetical protein
MEKVSFKMVADAWKKIPVPLQNWLHGLEVVVVSSVIAAGIGAPATNWHSKESIAKFAAGVGAAAYGALRLYIAQSPVQNVLKQVEQTDRLSTGGVTLEQTKTETLSGPAALATGGPAAAD